MSNGLDREIQLNSFSIQITDEKVGLITRDEIEMNESLEAGKSKTWILELQAFQQSDWSQIGADYALDWS